MLRVLGKLPSINVRKVLWTCAELGRDYALEEWGAGFKSTDDPAFRALNPNALVPVIIEGDVVLWESNTICRYLAASSQQQSLLPEAPLARARVEQWMDWQATELNTAWRYAFMGLVRKSPAFADAQAIAASANEWNRTMTVLDRQLDKTGAFAVGPELTLADIVLGLSTHRWRMTPIERPVLPAVDAYYARLSERPAFARFAPSDIP